MSFSKFDNSFQTLPKIFFEEVTPTPLEQAKMIAISESCAQILQLQIEATELKAWLNGEIRRPGDQRISTRYAGHQFGVWAGQLGDGRAISLGELVTPMGRQEIQTKGSGLTPFSRMGDGKAVIRSSVREFLASEAMHALKVPTTRALALLTGTDLVYREEIEKSGLVARVFPSNLRFGHFEYAFHFGHHEELKILAEYTLKTFFPQCASLEEMLLVVTSSTAKLIAQWQSLGFCHGVMNSDNMSVLGITIDYGPFGFMENYDPSWICNHSDHQGRYSYQNQAFIGLWNLDRLMQSFSPLVAPDELKKILETYETSFWSQFHLEFSQKLGFSTKQDSDPQMLYQFLSLLEKYSLDFTHSFRELPRVLENPPEIWQKSDLTEWLDSYRKRLKLEPESSTQRIKNQDLKNPKYVLRNYIAQEIISDVEQGNDTKLKLWMKILGKPFEAHPEFESYAQPTPKHLQQFEISCSS